MKILLVGGGSGGPVSPLLAVANEIKKNHSKAHFLLVGTKNGPEGAMAEDANIPFAFVSSGKLRRYFSLRNFFAPFEVAKGFFQAREIIKEFKPDCVFATGSFVQVPVVWAAYFKKIPVVLHQQDVMPNLANKLCQLATNKITVTFEQSLTGFFSGMGFFYKKRRAEKIILTGNPFREELKLASKEDGLKFFKLSPSLPTLLVTGGGTGAEFFNTLIYNSLSLLNKTVQIIHLTGKGKNKQIKAENYQSLEFTNHMSEAYAAADIVLSRAGLSALTELSNLKKLSIIVPMPNSPQELNAYLLERLGAAVVVRQDKINPKNFSGFIRKFLFEHKIQEMLKENIANIMPKNANQKITEVILKLAEQ